ncbi:FG-GAP-like repeat-containing protein [Patescibacteria group bacterium]
MKNKLFNKNIVLTIFLACSLVLLLGVFASVFMFSVKALPFWGSQQFPIGDFSEAIAYGDFDNDGYDDIAIDVGGYQLNIYMNDNGTFPATKTSTAPAGTCTPAQIISADFNGDNYDDLVAANDCFYDEFGPLMTGDLMVFLSNGNGTFGNSYFEPYGTTSYLCAVFPAVCARFNSVTAGDFDNDNDLDLAATDPELNKVVVFTNDGAGAFTMANSFSSGSFPKFISTADVDNDNNLDLLVANYNDSDVSVFFGDGTAVFSGRIDNAVSRKPFSLAVSDYNNDGIIDIATAGYFDKYRDHMTVFLGNDDGLGNGDGSFTQSYNYSYGTGLQFPAQYGQIYTKDFNGDSLSDLAITIKKNETIPTFTGKIAQFYNNGDGTFSPAGQYVISQDSNGLDEYYGTLAITDYNNDGNLDVAVTTYLGDVFNLLYGLPDGGFGGVGDYRLGNDPDYVYSADLNDDGNNDLVVANYADADIGFFLGYGNGAFQARTDFSVGGGPKAITSNDFNKDGDLDLAVATQTNSSVAILFGNSAGSFDPFSSYSTATSPRGLVSADFDGDGYDDVATANYNILGTSALSILFNNGDGSLAAPASYDGVEKALSLAAADLDGDNDQDIIIVGNWNVLREDNGIDGWYTEDYGATVHLNNGDGSFAAAEFLISSGFYGSDLFGYPPYRKYGGYPKEIKIADLNDDDIPDMAVANKYGDNGYITVLIGAGDGDFLEPVDYELTSEASGLSIGDLSGDEIPDIAATTVDVVLPDPNDSSVNIFVNNGNGTFYYAEKYDIGLDPTSVEIADFTNDGLADIAVVNLVSEDLNIFMNLDFSLDSVSPEAVFAGTPSFSLTTVGRGFDTESVVRINGSARSTSYISETHLEAQILNGDLTVPGINNISVYHNVYGNETNPVLLRVEPNFLPIPGNYLVNTSPKAVASADFDNDGDKDLVIVNSDSNNISVFLNQGLGTYDPKQDYPVGNVPVSVAVNDFNADGFIDVSVVNSADDNVSVLMGNGDGSFLTAVNYGAGTNPQAIFSADFDSNNYYDLAVANYDNNNVTVLLNNEDGTFAAGINYNAGTNPQYVLGADFNNDDIIDLITANKGSNNISLLLGIGDGTFNSATHFSSGTQPFSLTSADFNADDNQDVAIANSGSHNITIKQGSGSGSFNTGTTISVGTSPYSIGNGDYNNDSIKDLVVANSADNNISLFLGDGIGGFGSAVNYDVGTTPYSLLATDISGDNISDVVTTNSGSDDITILYGRGLLGVGTNLFNAPVNYSIFDPTTPVSADLDEDGNADLIVANYGYITPGYLRVFWGNGTGAWRTTEDIEIKGRQDDVLAKDIDNDTDIDLIVSAGGSTLYGNNIGIILNNGDGSFADPLYFNLGDNLFLQTLVCEDFNNDGDLDLAGGSYSSLFYTVFGQGDGTLATGSLASYTAGRLNTMTGGDFNNDNQPDIAAMSYVDDTIYIYIGDPGGTFTHLIDYSTQEHPQQIYSADINSDNNEDLLISRHNSHDIGIYLGNGDGTFADPYFYYIEDSKPFDIQALDVNNDNLLDIVVTNRKSRDGKVEIFLGYGNGNFDPNVSYDAGSGPSDFAYADFNNDSKIDLAVANTFSDNISILLGKVSQARSVRYSPAAPSNLVCQPINGQTIHWTFTDLATNEKGFRLYDIDRLIKSVGQPNMEYLEETDLLPNTLYEDRFVLTFNDVGESAASSKTGCYTLANEPLPLIIESDPLGTRIKIDINDSNPDYTQYAIYEYLSDRYLHFDGSLSEQEGWYTLATWGGETGIVAVLEDYELYVLAKNEDGIVSGYKPTAVDLRCEVQSPTEINWQMRISQDFINDGFRLLQPVEDADDTMIQDFVDRGLNSASYLEIELQPNSQYTRYLQAYTQIDGQYSVLGDSPEVSCFTLANEPLPVIIGEVTEDSVQIIINGGDGNPPETEYSLYEANSGLYVQADGSLGEEPVWLTRSEWGGEVGIYVNVLGASPEAQVEGQFVFSLDVAAYDFVAQVRNSDGVVTDIEKMPNITATKKVGVNVEVLPILIELEPITQNSIAKIANAQSVYTRNTTIVRMLQEFSVFINIILVILVFALIISILSTLKHLPLGKNMGDKLKFLLFLFIKQPVDAFADNAQKDNLGTYKQSYEKHRKYHQYVKKTLNRALGLLLVKVIVVILLVIGLSQLNHYSIAQDSDFDKDGQEVLAGDILTYKIEYINMGDGAAANVMIYDELDERITYITDSGRINKGLGDSTQGIILNDRMLSFNLGTVVAGEIGYAEFQAEIDRTSKGVLNNKAIISGDNFTDITTNITENSIFEETLVVLEVDLEDDLTAKEDDKVEPPTRIINNPPQAIDDTAEVNQDELLEILVLDNDSDEDDNINLASLEIVTAPINGVVSIALDIGAIIYTPNEAYVGADSFSYKICDLENACDQAIVSVTINPQVTTGLISEEGEEVGISIIGSLLNAVTGEISETRPAQGVLGSVVEANKTIKAFVESAPVKAVREKVLNNPAVETVSQDVVTPTLVTVAVVNTVPAVATVTMNIWSYLHFLFIEPLLLLFRRKRKKWGIVYDSLSKTPLSLAVVRLYSKKDKKLIQTKVTDKDGRYLIIVKEPGKYYLEITKPGFEYPSKILKGEKEDTKYVDLYHGEEIDVKEKGGVITANIPLDTKAEEVKPIKEVIKSYTIKNLRLITSYVGLILAVLVLIIYPSVITLVALIIHMAFYGTFRKILVPKKPKGWGIVYDKKTKEPLNYSVVRIFDMKFNKLLETQVTDAKGRYAFLASRNIYQLTAEKQGYQKEEIKDIDLVKEEDIVNLDIALKKGK